MFVRKLFKRQEIQELCSSDKLNELWSDLVYRKPGFFDMCWEVYDSQECRSRVEREKGWEYDNDSYLRVRDALLFLTYVLGDNLTTELLTIGRNPLLVSMMDIRKPILKGSNSSKRIDLQAVLLLVGLDSISVYQTFDDPNNFRTTLIQELSVEESFKDLLLELVLKVGMAET